MKEKKQEDLQQLCSTFILIESAVGARLNTFFSFSTSEEKL